MNIGICTTPQNAVLLTPGTADFIEINITALSQMNDKEFEIYCKYIDENSIQIHSANCFFPGDIRLCGKNYNPDKIKSYAMRALERLSVLSVPVCVLGSGKVRAFDADDDSDKCYCDFENTCLIIGDIAAYYGITVVIEPLNKKETNMINTVSEGAMLVRKLNHPNIKLLADIYHMAVENEDFNVISENTDIIRHMHIANPDGRIFPMRSDGFDYCTIAGILKKCDYNYELSIEAGAGGDFERNAEKSLLFLKEVFS